MELNRIEFRETISKDFNNVTVGVVADLAPTEDAKRALARLKEFVRDEINKAFADQSPENAYLERLRERCHARLDEINQLEEQIRQRGALLSELDQEIQLRADPQYKTEDQDKIRHLIRLILSEAEFLQKKRSDETTQF